MIEQIKDILRGIPLVPRMIKGITHSYRTWRSRGHVRRLLGEKAIHLEVGAGDKEGSIGWTTLDITPPCDIYWDATKGLPFPDGSMAMVYSSHFLEHIDFSQIRRFLQECVRILEPNGTFSICVPNARIYIEAYLNRTPLESEPFFSFGPAFNDTTYIDYVNYIAYMDGHHKYMFDEENLLHVLKSSGFSSVRLRDFDPALDLSYRDYESIYAEAVK